MKRVTKFLAVSLIALMSVFFMACNGEVPAEVLEAAKTELDIDYATGDSILSVTGDLTLPTVLETHEGVVITWSSNNIAVIQNDGTVIRGAQDASVIITATLTYEGENVTKPFTVVVKADPVLAVAAAKTALAITYTGTDIATNVTGDLTLPAYVGDVDVTWVSGTPAVITNAGVITRGASDVTVTLTATLTMGTTTDTKAFEVVVKANPTLAVAAAKNALVITYVTGDSATSVSDDVTLLTTLNGVTITWASDKTAVISAAGNVSRTLDEETVVLTATLTMGTVTDTKSFTLTVLADTRLGVAMDALEDHYADTLGNVEYVVSADIVLISTISGASVTWESKNTTYVSHAGVITRPTFTQGSQTIELVATVTVDEFSDTVSFFAYLEKLAKSDQEIADEVLLRATAFPAAEGIASDLELVLTAKDDDDNDYTVTWASSNVDVIAIDGTVTQDLDNDIMVTLTATVTINEVPYTRSVTFKVFKESTAIAVNSIADALNEDVDTYVKIMGLTVLGVYGTGNYVVTDGVGVYVVYAVDSSFTVTIGKVYNITGVTTIYYGAPELVGDVTGKPFVFEEVVDATPEEAPMTVATVAETIIAQPTGTISNTNPMVYRYFTVTGKVFVSLTLEDNYNTYIVSDTFTGTPSKETAIMIYYPSNIAAVREFDGKEVTIDLMMVGYRSDKLVWYANFLGVSDDIDAVELTGQDALDADLAWLTMVDEVESKEEITIPAVGPYGSAIAWSVVSGANADIISGSTITFPAFSQDTDVILKATLTLGELVAVEKQFTVTVKREIIPALPGQELFFSEYIEGGSNNKALEIYNPSSVTIDLSTYVVEVYSNGSLTAGNTITLSGFLAPGEVFVIGNPSEDGVDPVIVAESDITSTVTYFNGDDALVMRNGALIIDSIGKVGVDPAAGYWGSAEGSTADWTMVRKATVRGGRTDIYGDYDPASEWDFYPTNTVSYLGSHTIIEGDLIFSEYIEGSSNNKVLEIYNASNMTIDLSRYSVEQYKDGATAATMTLVLTGTLAPGEVIVITTDEAVASIQEIADFIFAYGVVGDVVHFGGDDALVLKNGTLIIDSIGKVGEKPAVGYWGTVEIATKNFTLVRKANVRVGRTDATGDFDPANEWDVYPIDTFTDIGSHSMNALDLFFSEYIEGSSNNKVLEIYNPTNMTIDLSRYSVEQYKDGATAATMTLLLTGTLAPGEVIVITTDEAVASIQEIADFIFAYGVVGDVVHFGGDDALVLKNGTLIIDSIGKVGEKPAVGYWGTVEIATKNFTLVRKANITKGHIDINAAYNPADHWSVYPIDTYTYIGSHTMDATDHAALAAADVTALTIDLAVDGLEEVTLPATQGASAITWAFKEATTYATLDGNKITFSNVDVEQTVLLTATLTYSYVGIDSIMTTKDFTLTVSPITVVTDISTLNVKTVDAWTIANDTFVYVEGVVTGNYISYGSEAGTFIQDAEGNGIYVHGLKGQTIGDKIIIYGKLGEYSSVRQMSSAVRKMVVSTGNEIVVTTMTPAELEAILPNYYEYAGMVIEVTGLVVKEYRTANGYLDIYWIDDVTDYLLSIYYNTDAYSWMSTIFPATSILPKIQFTLYNIYNTNTYNITNMVVELTEAQSIQLDADEFPANLILSENFEIPAATYGSTYTVTGITGDAATFIDFTTTPGTLIITTPTDTNKTGVITISVSKGEAVAQVIEIDVTVTKEGFILTVMDQVLTGTAAAIPTGWTYSGLGSAYADGSLKMDGTGDNITTANFTLSGNATFSITIKGNSIVDDADEGPYLKFYDQNDVLLHTFSTEIVNSQVTLSFTITDPTVTHVKFIYTKDAGNLGIYSVQIEHVV